LNVDLFLSQFLTPPNGSSPQALFEKAKHWIAVVEFPKQHFPNADEFELRVRRRNARQVLRRLLAKHPELIPMLRSQQ
jgi:hypothetical protein